MFRGTLLLSAALLLPCPALACSLCGGGLQGPTFRLDAAQPSARMILYGPIQNGAGTTTDLTVEEVLRSNAALGDRKTVALGKYLPVNDPKDPPHYLVFCDVDKSGKPDPYRGVLLRGPDALDYVKKVLALDAKDAAGRLKFYFEYLENKDKAVAQDAFLEFARSTDQEIGQAAGQLSAEKLRTWLKADAPTPPERLSLYAFLLGACGGDADADFLLSQLKKDDERIVNAYDGFLGGYIQLRPKDGWKMADAITRDGRQPLPIRLSVVRTVRMFHGWKPKETHDDVLRCLQGMLAQGELADIAVEDLRRWQMSELTGEVLSLYGKKGFDAPLMQRAIVRYAVSRAPNDDAARQFVAERRKKEPDLVKEVEESLQFEK
jgi:hypothetical protein